MISVLSGLVSVAQHQNGDSDVKEVALLTAGQQVVHVPAINRAWWKTLMRMLHLHGARAKPFTVTLHLRML